jgi:hypothetical protein
MSRRDRVGIRNRLKRQAITGVVEILHTIVGEQVDERLVTLDSTMYGKFLQGIFGIQI